MRVSDWRVTAAIAGLMLVASGLVIVNGWVDRAAFGWGFVPASVGGATAAGALPFWLTPLTATLVHGNWLGLTFDLLILLFCGSQAERPVGGAGVAILYVAGAYAGAVGQWLLDPSSSLPLFGASGAISAVIAAYALLYGRRREGVSHLANALWLGAAWVALQLLMALASAGTGLIVAVAAPVAGFAAGLALARPLLRWRYRHA